MFIAIQLLCQIILNKVFQSLGIVCYLIVAYFRR